MSQAARTESVKTDSVAACGPVQQQQQPHSISHGRRPGRVKTEAIPILIIALLNYFLIIYYLVFIFYVTAGSILPQYL